MINIWLILLYIVGSLVLGFILGFITFIISSKIIDWKLKRKAKKLSKEDLAKPDKQEITEKEVDLRNDRTNREFRQYRQFEKLRNLTTGKQPIIRGESITPIKLREPQRSDIQDKIINNPVSDESEPSESNTTIRFY